MLQISLNEMEPRLRTKFTGFGMCNQSSDFGWTYSFISSSNWLRILNLLAKVGPLELIDVPNELDSSLSQTITYHLGILGEFTTICIEPPQYKHDSPFKTSLLFLMR